MSNRREEFLRDLHALLNRHRVVLSASDHFDGYPECGEDIRITASFEWDSKEFYSIKDVEFDQFILPEDVRRELIKMNLGGK